MDAYRRRAGSHADELLVATGRRPVLDEHDLVAAGIELTNDDKPVLDDVLRTTARSVWAVGDATGDLLFTHVATYEAGVVVAAIRGRARPKDYRVVPRVTFTSPAVASVGLTEHEAARSRPTVRVGRLDLTDNERASIDGRPAGSVKIVTDGEGQILGGHIVAEQAGTMIHEVVALMAGHVPADVAADAIHAYPTLSEAVKGALDAVA
jgi:pyruvate/2-oxoglutarate dehydrogenase complex dihydrolipoamide dehydrogenase (E3) component